MTSVSHTTQEYTAPLIKYLHELLENEDRGKLAVLKRAISNEGIDFSAYPVVGSRLPNVKSPRGHQPYLLTACLFALHQIPTDNGQTIGHSTRVLRNRLDAGEDSLDRRFAAVLNASEEDLPIHLRHLFSLLKANEIAVDYSRLLKDLKRWRFDSKDAQTQWAHDYWVGSELKDDDDTSTTDSTNTQS